MPAVAANPIPSGGDIIGGMPIIVAVLNYPINGVIILIFLYRTSKQGLRSPAWEGGHFLGDVGGAILQFTLLGALIDAMVWFHTPSGDMGAVLIFAFGLAAVGVTTAIVCTRYLWMSWKQASSITLVLIAVNLLSWVAFYSIHFVMLFPFNILLVIIAWLGFVFILFRMNREQQERDMDDRQDPYYGRPMGQGAAKPSFQVSVSRFETASRRLEMWLVNVVLLALVFIASAGIEIV